MIIKDALNEIQISKEALCGLIGSIVKGMPFKYLLY